MSTACQPRMKKSHHQAPPQNATQAQDQAWDDVNLPRLPILIVLVPILGWFFFRILKFRVGGDSPKIFP